MHLHPYSTKQLNIVMNDEKVYSRLQEILGNEEVDLDLLKKVAKVCMMEFGVKPDDWDKLLFLLKVASCCNGDNH